MTQIEAASYVAFEEDGRFYLFNSARVSLFQVPEPVFRIAGLWESHCLDDIRKELLHFYPQVQVEKCLTDTVKLGLFAAAPPAAHDPAVLPTPFLNELYLQVCHDCNLKCRYCYADGGHFGAAASTMDDDTARRAVDLFLDQLPAEQMGFINYDGGEPLLNWPLIERTTQYAETNARAAAKRIGFKLGTNGTLLNSRIAAFMNHHRFSVGISIDGDQEAHDACRPYYENTGSYQKIKENISAYKNGLNDCTLQARATITHTNLRVFDVVNHLLHLGFANVYFEPVTGTSPALSEADYAVIENQCDRLADFYTAALLRGEKIALTNFDMFLKRLHLKKKFVYKCEVGRTGIAVTPSGEIFPCYKFANTEGFKMADVFNGGFHLTNQHQFLTNHVDARPDCNTCWARYLCGGGCAYLGYLDGGDITKKNKFECRFILHMIKRAMQIYVTVNQKEPGFWNRYFK